MQTTGVREKRTDDHKQAVSMPRRLELIEADAGVRYSRGDSDVSPYYYDGDRRTVVITGQPVPARRRPPRAKAQIEARPDRIALWAFGLGILLVLMALATAGGGPA